MTCLTPLRAAPEKDYAATINPGNFHGLIECDRIPFLLIRHFQTSLEKSLKQTMAISQLISNVHKLSRLKGAELEADLSVKKEALAAGAVAFFEKPFHIDSLLASIDKIIRPAQSKGNHSSIKDNINLLVMFVLKCLGSLNRLIDFYVFSSKPVPLPSCPPVRIGLDKLVLCEGSGSRPYEACYNVE